MAADTAWPALILIAVAIGGPPQPAASPLRVTFNLAPLERDLKARIAREPNHISNRIELARLYNTVDFGEGAERTLLDALAIERSPRVYRQLIEHYRRHRQYALAIPIALEWSEREPSDPEPRVQLAAAHLYHPAPTAGERLGFAARGLAHADSALTLAPGHVPALEMKRQLLALKWLLSEPDDRPAIDAEQRAFGRVFSVAPPERPPWRSRPRQAIKTASGAPPLFVRRNEVPEPARITVVKPRYPAEAIRAGIKGVVWFEVLIDESGKVAEAWAATMRRDTPPAQLHLLEQAVLDSLEQWRFAPTLVNGKPVTVVLDLMVEFVLTLGPSAPSAFRPLAHGPSAPRPLSPSAFRGYNSRNATIGSTRAARRAGM